jgi:hypothetical protein
MLKQGLYDEGRDGAGKPPRYVAVSDFSLSYFSAAR